MELVWDQTGERRFEAGIDRGVLYVGEVAVPWNGLTSVSEDTSRDVQSYYHDGLKYLDHYTIENYSGKLQAFTYPDILDDLLGVVQSASGAFIHEQPFKPFSLSYRTKVGNDLAGLEHGYKIHIIYNVTANPSEYAHNTLDDSPDTNAFEWTLSGMPQMIDGFRPTSHISIDSRRTPAGTLAAIEARLYGTPTQNPGLIPMTDLLALT